MFNLNLKGVLTKIIFRILFLLLKSLTNEMWEILMLEMQLLVSMVSINQNAPEIRLETKFYIVTSLFYKTNDSNIQH